MATSIVYKVVDVGGGQQLQNLVTESDPLGLELSVDGLALAVADLVGVGLGAQAAEGGDVGASWIPLCYLILEISKG